MLGATESAYFKMIMTDWFEVKYHNEVGSAYNCIAPNVTMQSILILHVQFCGCTSE